MPESDGQFQRLQDQTAQNTQDIASLITSVTSLAHTVERHERMMVDGFNKMEQALEKGLTSVTLQIDRERSKAEEQKIPWWQLLGVLTAFISVFGGALVAFVLILHSSQTTDIHNMRDIESSLQEQVIENRVQAQVNAAVIQQIREDREHGSQ